MSAKKHTPERTCIACRQTKPKWELIRIVHTPKGDIAIDEKGKSAGRGAYLCKRKECWESALMRDRKDRLGRALKTEISLEGRMALLEHNKTLPLN